MVGSGEGGAGRQQGCEEAQCPGREGRDPSM